MERKRKSQSSSDFADMESKKRTEEVSSGSGSSSSDSCLQAVPDDILCFDILPRLSFKSLSKFQSVCKPWHALISDDPLFALDQSRRPSPISSGFVYLSCHGLEFLHLPGTPIGVPDPSLSMLNSSHRRIRLIASTNGLLCLRVYALYFDFLSLVNPATMESESILPHNNNKNRHYSIGLAFDPSTSPTQYTLVYPVRKHINEDPDGVEYQFEVFSSSRTGGWVKSSQKVTLGGFQLRHRTTGFAGGFLHWDGFQWRRQTSVFAGGVLYWDCMEYLIWFDPCKDLAGWMLLPIIMPTTRNRHALGVSEGQLTCMVTSQEAVEVFVMKNACINGSSSGWSRRYQVCLDGMIEKNLQVFAEFCNTMRLRSRSPSERLFSRWFVQPLAFEGGEKLYLWVRASKGKKKGRVLCHDMRTGELTVISNSVSLAPGENQIFPYHNSMARLPLC